jgi:hypothetical protein
VTENHVETAGGAALTPEIESESVRVFEALTLNELGRADEAVGLLLGVVAQHGDATDLGRYADGLAGLAQWLVHNRDE